MTSDQNTPDIAQNGQGAPPPMSQQDSLFEGSSNGSHGMGQSKSSRRRRRKRKSKTEGGDQGEQVASTGGEQPSSTGETIPTMQASAPRTESAPRQFQPSQANGAGQSQNNANGTGAKRWKKKFRDRQRGGSFENNGSSQNAGSATQGSHSNSNGGSNGSSGGGFRSADTTSSATTQALNARAEASAAGAASSSVDPRSFVGPMDHSYRVVNGNFADSPPSTIETHSNGNYQGRSHGARQSYQSDSQPIDYSQGRAIPSPKTPRRRLSSSSKTSFSSPRSLRPPASLASRWPS